MVALLCTVAVCSSYLLAGRAASPKCPTAAAGADRAAGASDARPIARKLQQRGQKEKKPQQKQQEEKQQYHPQQQQQQQRAGLHSSWAIAAEEASWEVPPRYSTHSCLGPHFDDNWRAASCKFDNVCLNASTLEFEYYQNTDLYPRMPVAHDQLAAMPMYQFSDHMLSPVHWMMDKTRKLSWRPVVKLQPFPHTGDRVKWAPVPQGLLQSYPQRFLVNFGHVQFDLAVPLFNLQHLFGIYRPDAQVLVLNKTLSDNWEEVAYYMERMINTPKPERSIFRLSWDSDAAWLSNYAQRVLGDADDGLVCFKTLLVGTGNLTRRGRATDALPYRAAVAERLGLQEPPFGHEERPVITMLDKEGRRIIENYPEVRDMLAERYPGALVQLYDFGKHPDLTMAEQVELMSQTSILISPCGGLATVLSFLRPGSTAIVMNFWHTHLNRSVMMEDAFYQNLEYLDLQYFPVTLEDYTGTTDRPECELMPNGTRRHDSRFPQSGALVNCNLFFGQTAKQRMLYYVDAAMMRWAARKGRFDIIEPLQRLRAAEMAAEADGSSGSVQGAAAATGAAAAAGVEDKGASTWVGLPLQQAAAAAMEQ